MTDVIKLLPDALANQIAAGEVIQRPGSVVKELMENAIDAGAKNIQLLVKDSGKQLIQVIDDGCGMSETDARMCFEKHATSKIRNIDDLFKIRTMGFRGEALASVAAIASVELKTRQHDSELGTLVEIEGMKILRHEPIGCQTGTSVAVKNIFFNVPARRQFLKSDTVEYKYISEEFIRIALSNAKNGFRLFHNGQEQYHLKPGNLKQRIIGLFGEHYAERIIPVEEETYGLRVSGFVGKPEAARKTRGEQFLFVNGRYVRSSYLNHAINMAYDGIIARDNYPFYVLFIDIDPAKIDVNVHPQKYEIKFEDERLVYTFLNKGIVHSLGAYAISPSLDFNQEDHLNRYGAFEKIFSPHTAENTSQRSELASGFTTHLKPGNLSHWKQMFDAPEHQPEKSDDSVFHHLESDAGNSNLELQTESAAPRQLHRKYILTQIKSGILLLDQQAAHERILYEDYLELLDARKPDSQPQLFPQSVELSPADAAMLHQILPELHLIGFDIQPFGQHTFLIQAVPVSAAHLNEKELMDQLLENYRMHTETGKIPGREAIARSLATGAAVKSGKALSDPEMRSLIDQLFACKNPYTAPNGKKTFIRYSLQDLEQLFITK